MTLFPFRPVARLLALATLLALLPAPPARGAGEAATITVRIATGSDDLRGGAIRGTGNNLHLALLDERGRPVVADRNANRSQTWAANSDHTVVLRHEGTLAALAHVELAVTDRMKADVFEQTDQWSLDAITITANVRGRSHVLYDARPRRKLVAGAPPVRLALRPVVDQCASDADCDDGRHCNGVEACAAATSAGALRQCRPGRPVVCPAGSRCDESADRCLAPRLDRDGDGSFAMESGGDDCDDGNARRFPGNAEVCDADGVDEDCDLATGGTRDLDRDGHTDAACFNWGPPPRR